MVASAITLAAVQLLKGSSSGVGHQTSPSTATAVVCCSPSGHHRATGMQPSGTAASAVSTATAVAAAPPPGIEAFEQLKQDLVAAVDNNNISGAMALLLKLDESTVTKEILEATRLGGTVNEIRRKTAEIAPQFSKKCKNLIKKWQKLIDYVRPTSSVGSSASTTPSLVSPAIRGRGVTPKTPRTPANKITTPSGGLKADSHISPGYAPKKISPLANAPALHKSMSVGADLSRQAVEKSISPPNKTNGESPPSNGIVAPLRLTIKRSATGTEVNGSALKRSKTSVAEMDHHLQGLRDSAKSAKATPSPRAVVQPISVTEARKKVQSTADLVAQLSENLPEHMAIDLSEHEKRVKATETPMIPPMTILRSTLPDVSQTKTKRKYTKRHPRFFKNGQYPEQQVSPVERSFSLDSTLSDIKEEHDSEESLPDRVTFDLMPDEDEEDHKDQKLVEIKPSVSIDMDDVSEMKPSTSAKVSEKVEKVEKVEKTVKKEEEKKKRGFDWMTSLVPSVEEIEKRMSQQVEPSEDPRRSYIMRSNDRDILCLPFVDIGMPDFLEYNYPNPDQYIWDRTKRMPF